MDKKQHSQLPAAQDLSSSASHAKQSNKMHAPYLDSVTRERLWLALSVMQETKKTDITIH